ncbi:hypothetical protein [Tepidibacillus fermentans]|uniref:Uncharacterized protein n=1 Tax=Tepidibacillus fermentans TaxID=1281767 RepID=A0A4R3KGV8_9BACI|nr:hypothetical protein [Tepidibacillus fermentans]TCS82578.1 hypothetical protein EDD72_10868 [Tepidibacillus fermentans]
MKRKQMISIFMVALLIVMAISFSGCNQANQNQAGQQDMEKVKSDVKSAVLVAENKLTLIFEPNDNDVLVAKPRYKTLDDVKKFLTGYYTEQMAQKLVDSYVKMEKVGDTEVPVLQLSEDYVKLESQQADVKVENNKATVSFTDNGKTVTYGLIKQNDQWIVNSKEVK